MSNQEGMNWAAVAASGPHQSPEEARAPPVDTIIPNESASTSSLVDVDSGVSVVPSDFLEQEVKTETQATRLVLEAEAEAARAAAEQQRKQQNEHNQQNGSSKGSSKKAQAKKQVRRAEDYTEKHPAQVINAVLGTVAAIALGVGAYKKWKVGELSWRVVGIWGGAVAAVAAVDAFATRIFLNRKSNN